MQIGSNVYWYEYIIYIPKNNEGRKIVPVFWRILSPQQMY